MAQGVHGLNPSIPPGQLPAQPARRGRSVRPNHSSARRDFKEVLHGEVNKQKEVKFSSHAQNRLQMRDIELTSEEKMRLNEAVDKAAKKGARESLVLMNDLAFLISVRNRMVITAIAGERLRDGVFTHIDSAVVIRDIGLDLFRGGPAPPIDGNKR